MAVELGISADRRGVRALDAAGLAVAFLVGTLPGLMVAGTLALCTLVSFVDLGIAYERRAFVGAGLAVAASVASELVFGAFIRQAATWQAYRWRAAARGVGAVGGALFASGGLGALELSSSARPPPASRSTASPSSSPARGGCSAPRSPPRCSPAARTCSRTRASAACAPSRYCWWSRIPPVLVMRANSAVPASKTRPRATTKSTKPATGMVSRLAA